MLKPFFYSRNNNQTLESKYKMKSVGVFCGANHGTNLTYSEAASSLGELMAAQRIALVYGGGNVGLMGTIADAILLNGGEAIGVIPQSLVDREVAHKNLTELHIVQTMHERKAMMAAKSDAFIAMPGGFGTFDEIFEIITWNQLGIIKKPVAFYNVNGFYDKLLAMVSHCIQEEFIKPDQLDNLIVEDNPEVLLQRLIKHSDLTSDYWVDFKRI
jgi:uncharacterized protein (TIGR00730 family)